MKRNNKLKKIIMGGIGFAMAIIVFFVGSMQSMQEVAADVRVFDRVTEEYPANDSFEFNILEIVPSGGSTVTKEPQFKNMRPKSVTLDTRAEMGYFIAISDAPNADILNANTNLNKDIKEYGDPKPDLVSYGGVHGLDTSTTENPDTGTTPFGDVLNQLRNYGMIRPSGTDTTGTYPIYATKEGKTGLATFSNYKSDICSRPYNKSYVKGIYSLGAGDYNIADGYTVSDNGAIYKVDKVQIVSENSTLSENNPTYDADTNTITKHTLVTDIDMTALSLPKSASGFEYITEAASPKTGNLKFVRSETVTQKTEYYGFSDQTLYHIDWNTSGLSFLSSSYFKEYVLGSKKNYFGYDITYNVVEAKSVTVEMINNADLIYISGKDVAFRSCDITQEVMLEIYNKEVNDHKAVMMDYACYSSESDTNISKLAILLWRESQSEIKTAYSKSYTEGTDNLANLDFMDETALKELKSTMMKGANGNFVTGNVYVYNHHMSDFDDPKSLVDAGDNFANGDFNSAYTASVMQTGFQEVLNYITTTNKNSTTGSMLPSVTPAVAIQYILISDGKPLSYVKTSLHVLEIQPVSSFLYNEKRGTEEYGYLDTDSDVKQNRDDFITNYLGNYYDDKAEYITFTSMTVDEFNGRNEDLIETYDIVYIGSEMGDYYELGTVSTEVDGNTVEAQLPVYNDAKMSGMVYYNIGDTLTVQEDRLKKFLDIDTTDARFAGRDITKDKLNKLISYLDSDGLILVEGDLVAQVTRGYSEVNPTAIDETSADKTLDHGRIDNSSNMYELMKYATGYRFNSESGLYENRTIDGDGSGAYKVYSNLISVADIVNQYVDKSTVETYVATEKMELTMISQPKEYSYFVKAGTQIIDPTTVQYMEENSNGTRQLEYEFIISSDVDAVSGSNTYEPHLYVDINNDGKYSSKTEDIKDIQIVVEATGQEAERNANNVYVLYKDVQYKMIRELDESYSGFLNWKLTVRSNVDKNAYASAKGNTVVKNKGDEELIKILQITNNGTASNLNLEAQENDTSSLFGKYLAAVPGYKVEIKTIGLSEFETDFKTEWEAYQADTTIADKKSLEEYALEYFNSVDITDSLSGADMLILGFGDDFPSISYEPAITAIQSYMESEKPVLLAHDFIMYWASVDKWGVMRNHGRYLRHNVGMDKYGVTQNIKQSDTDGISLVNAVRYPGTGSAALHSGVEYTRTTDKDTVALIENTGKSVAYMPGTGRQMLAKTTQGLSNSVLMRFQNGTNSWLDKAGALENYYGRGDYIVDKMNDGQITSYPYALPDSYQVNGTHGQYFQLDLDADEDNDGETDVVVWYTLGEFKSTAYKDSKQTQKYDYNPWGDNVGGPMPSDGYYIYNKGNVTYTGAGDSNMENATETEAQLFINTLFAAYNAAQTKPSVGFYENVPDADSAPINNIAVPYDENVTGDNTIDSSVIKDATGNYRYYFVNPNTNINDEATKKLGTPIYFRLSDTNFVRGNKYMEIEYYLKVDEASGSNIKLDDGTNKTVETLKVDDTLTANVVNISDKIETFNKELNTIIARDTSTQKISTLESGVVYGFYLPLSYLDTESHITIYMTAKTRVQTVSSQTGQAGELVDIPHIGVSELTVTKTDLLDLD